MAKRLHVKKLRVVTNSERTRDDSVTIVTVDDVGQSYALAKTEMQRCIARRVCAPLAASARTSAAGVQQSGRISACAVSRCSSSSLAVARLRPVTLSRRALLTETRRNWSRSTSAAAAATNDARASEDSEPSKQKTVDGKTGKAASTGRAARAHWNVHHEIVKKKKSLPQVFEQLKEEKQLRTLKAAFVRQAVDMFYFHCVQQVHTLDEQFRLEVLRYFNEELFQVSSDDAESANGKRFVLGESLNEAAFSAVIKLHLHRNEADAAWGVVDKLHQVANAKLHFRTVGSILEHECRNGEFLEAYARWQQLKDGEVGWTSAMEDVLIQMVLSCHASHHVRQETSSEQFNVQMTQLLRDLRLSCKEISHASSQRLRQVFHDSGYSAKTLPSDHAMCPTCFSCGLPLVKKDITAAERQQLLLAIESRESKVMKDGVVTAKDFLAPFKSWLLAKHRQVEGSDKLHFILDGPNIAYINQNFDAGSCRLDHIDAVADMLLAEGHQVSITMPFSYLADKIVLRIRTKRTKAQQKQGKFTTRMRTEEEKALIEKWQRQDMIFSCRTDFISDDLFWLYASVLLGKEGRVVTNDQGRDHVFALLNSKVSKASKSMANKKQQQQQQQQQQSDPPEISMDLIDRWKELSIVNIEIQHEEVHPDQVSAPAPVPPLGKNGKSAVIPIEEIRLLHPLPFSRVPQATARDHFHLPISSETNGGAGGVPSVSATPAANAKNTKKKWLCLHRKAPPSGDAQECNNVRE